MSGGWTSPETNGLIPFVEARKSEPSARAEPASGGDSRKVSHISPRQACTVAIASGKGGVGKSFITSSLGIGLARRGQRVVLVDADLGGANLHTALGLPPAEVTLADLIHRNVDHIEEVRSRTGIANLSIVSGAYDYLIAANLNYQQKLRMLREIRSLDADFALIDLGAGLSLNVVDFFLLGSPGILVVAPEPGSILTAYRFLKTSFYRHIWTKAPPGSLRQLIRDAMYEKNARRIRTPADLFHAIAEIDKDAETHFRAWKDSFHPWLVVNQVRTREDKRLGPTMCGVCYKHLGVDMESVQPIYFDDRIWQSNRDQKPYVISEPAAPAAKNLDRLAGRLLLHHPPGPGDRP